MIYSGTSSKLCFMSWNCQHYYFASNRLHSSHELLECTTRQSRIYISNSSFILWKAFLKIIQWYFSLLDTFQRLFFSIQSNLKLIVFVLKSNGYWKFSWSIVCSITLLILFFKIKSHWFLIKIPNESWISE